MAICHFMLKDGRRAIVQWQPCQSWITSVKGCWAAGLGKIYGHPLRRADFHKASWQTMWPSLETAPASVSSPYQRMVSSTEHWSGLFGCQTWSFRKRERHVLSLQKEEREQVLAPHKEQNIHVHTAQAAAGRSQEGLGEASMSFPIDTFFFAINKSW